MVVDSAISERAFECLNARSVVVKSSLREYFYRVETPRNTTYRLGGNIWTQLLPKHLGVPYVKAAAQQPPAEVGSN